jgi:hypothetical protein
VEGVLKDVCLELFLLAEEGGILLLYLFFCFFFFFPYTLLENRFLIDFSFVKFWRLEDGDLWKTHGVYFC